MPRQAYLFGDNGTDHLDGGRPAASIGHLRVTTWNVQNPSEQRARAQLSWLADSASDVLVLSELRSSAGSFHILSTLEARDYRVHFDEPRSNGYGVAVCVRGLETSGCVVPETLGSRVAVARLHRPPSDLLIVGVYAPSKSFGELPERVAAREAFHGALLNELTPQRLGERALVLGDFNVVEPNHTPRLAMFGSKDYAFYRGFLERGLADAYRHFNPDAVEHSWFDQSGALRQRIDHAFCTQELLLYTTGCRYEHGPRFERLSDHSALHVEVRFPSSPTPG